MTLPSIQAAQDSEREQIIQLITLGFVADPVGRWIWPDAHAYMENMPRFVAAFGGRAFEHGTADHAGTYQAAALWLPPGVEPDVESMGALLEASISSEIANDMQSVLEQMDRYHPHEQPCWYLPLIAADPAYMGRGLGSALMKHALRRCDESGQIAYLESSNPRNISLYERHGFEVIGKIQAGSSPVMHPMVRQPQGY